MSKRLITNFGLGAAFLVASMTANAGWIEVATDTLTFDTDIIAQTSSNWGSCADNGQCRLSSTSLKYTVSHDVGVFGGQDTYKWLYEYEWFGYEKHLSHIIIELSPDLNNRNGIIDINTFGTAVNSPSYDIFSSSKGNSNPSMPSAMYGVKLDLASGTNVNSFKFSIETWRAPMWGDFYAKDGKQGGNDVYAYNKGFGNPDTDPSLDVSKLLANDFLGSNYTGYVRDHIMRPDTVVIKKVVILDNVVPEPATLGLLGLGMLAMGALRRRKVALKR